MDMAESALVFLLRLLSGGLGPWYLGVSAGFGVVMMREESGRVLRIMGSNGNFMIAALSVRLAHWHLQHGVGVEICQNMPFVSGVDGNTQQVV